MNLAARILLIIPFIPYYNHGDACELILLTFGLVGVLFNIWLRLSVVCVVGYLGLGEHFDLNVIWAFAGLLLIIPKINWSVSLTEPELVKVSVKDPWAKRRDRESFIDWFLGKNTKKFPPYFYCLIYSPILGVILILIISRFVHY